MLKDKWQDFVYWYRDKPFTKIWRGIKDRVDAFIFCFLLLLVGIYSPKALRKIMIDSLKD
jgi:hypothetical protein